MNSINLKEALTKAEKIILGLPNTVCEFAGHLASKINDDALSPEEVVNAIGEVICDVENNDPHIIVEDKKRFLSDARFILQVIDEIADTDFSDKVFVGCRNKFGWMPIRRVKIADRELLSLVFTPSIVTAVEWWTTAIQLVDTKEFTNDKDNCSGNSIHSFSGFTIEQMFDFRYALANELRTVLESTDFETFGAFDAPIIMAIEQACLLKCEIEYVLPSDLIMSVSQNDVEIADSLDSDFITVWKAK